MNVSLAAAGSSRRGIQWRPTPVGAIAGSLVAIGILVPAFAPRWTWWFFTLTALGSFGPGVLREAGWLRDKDEFQRRAEQRAGYLAYLATGAVAVLMYAYTRSGDRHLGAPEELTLLYLSLLWFTWVFTSLLSFWGARRTAATVLVTFGAGWGLFNIASDLAHPVVMLMQLLVTTVPFFVAAWVSTRWPRVAGMLLLGIAAAFGWLMWGHAVHGAQPFVIKAGVSVLFVGPVLLSGLALLRVRAGNAETDEPAGRPAA